jgi:hypothetical protein
VEFGELDDRLWMLGANIALDTRGDPAFPRNAIMVGAGWTGLHVRRLDDPINRYTAEARGYVGVIRQAVFATRVQYYSADRTLPDYERLLLGGASNLRGFDTGAFDGDRMFVSSAELRVPITSVLSGAKLGLTAFMDAGKAFNVGQSMKDAAWHRERGRRLLIATIVRLTLTAHGLKTGIRGCISVRGSVFSGSQLRLVARPSAPARPGASGNARSRARPRLAEHLITNHTLAGRSASRRMYHGNQCSP